MQELYELEPDVELLCPTDTRMFEVLKSEQGIDYALLMPLTDSGRMIGSLHLGLQDDTLISGEQEEQLISHLATMISSCFKAAVSRQQVSQLTMLDPLTQISNLRGFEKDITREIARARRADQALTILIMEIDEFEELYDHYGERSGHFVVKKVAERISSDLRATDMMARLSRSKFALLIPGSGEMLGQEIAERMRDDIEDFAVDDGRGAVLAGHRQYWCGDLGAPAVSRPWTWCIWPGRWKAVARKAPEASLGAGGKGATHRAVPS